MEILARSTAIALGRKRFYTGRPCKYGHDSERYITTGACIACLHPKLPAAAFPDPVESYTLPNGRILQRMTRDHAASIGWTVYFTGVPCEKGHIIERYVKSALCIECAHPTVYGPDMNGLPPFQPKPPLRVPIGTPLSLYARIAELIQAEIPRLAEQAAVESGIRIEVALDVRPSYGVLPPYTPANTHGTSPDDEHNPDLQDDD